MNKLKKYLISPAVDTIQAFKSVWYEQKFSKQFDETVGIYITGKDIYIFPAKLSPDLEFIELENVNRLFTTDTCNKNDKLDRYYAYHDPTDGRIKPAFILYHGNPAAIALKPPLIDKIKEKNNIMAIPAQSMENYYIDSDLSAIAYKFYKYIILRFVGEQNKRELILILLAWGAFCLFIGAMITMYLIPK